MTPERARQLVSKHGCRIDGRSFSMLNIVNERINFRYQIPFECLEDIDENAFIETITTGRVRRGQSLPGSYCDYRPLPDTFI